MWSAPLSRIFLHWEKREMSFHKMYETRLKIIYIIQSGEVINAIKDVLGPEYMLLETCARVNLEAASIFVTKLLYLIPTKRVVQIVVEHFIKAQHCSGLEKVLKVTNVIIPRELPAARAECRGLVSLASFGKLEACFVFLLETVENMHSYLHSECEGRIEPLPMVDLSSCWQPNLPHHHLMEKQAVEIAEKKVRVLMHLAGLPVPRAASFNVVVLHGGASSSAAAGGASSSAAV